MNFGYVAQKSYYKNLHVFLRSLLISVRDNCNTDGEKRLELLGLRAENKSRDIS